MKPGFGDPPRRAVYVLSKSQYFLGGPSGRVTHAIGVIEGLVRNGWSVDVVSGPGLDDFVTLSEFGGRLSSIPLCGIRLANGGEIRWRRRLLTLLAKHMPRADIVLFRYAMSQPCFALRVARLAAKYEVTSVLEVNSLGYHHLEYTPKILGRGLLWLEAKLASKFDIVYAVSRALKEDLREARCRARIAVVPNAATDLGSADTQGGMANTREVRIVYCGVFQPYYEFNILFEAFRRLTRLDEDVELALYGHGPDLISEWDPEEHDRITFHGPYEREELPQLLDARRDVLVVPYAETRLTRIGSPTKLFEYLSLGIPLVASDVGQVGSIVEDGRTGYLYSAGHVESLVEVFMRVLNKSGERMDIACRARREFREKHTWRARMEALGHLCEQHGPADRKR